MGTAPARTAASRRTKRRRYYLKHREALRAKAAKYYRDNRERLLDECRQYRARTASEQRERAKRYYRTHKAEHGAGSRRRKLKKYGLTPAKYEALLGQQCGKCAICRAPNNGAKRFHVDHCHDSGMVRGLLCTRCNTGIGLLKTPEALTAAALYLNGGLNATNV